MAQTDILNPTPTHPLNPDYGFQRKRPVTHLSLKANHGAPYFRDITDVGHQFVLTWADKTASDAKALKRYYEQYRDGFFTLIDHEGGGRHYVGRFTAPVEPVPTSHGHWTVQLITFDEVPGAPMLVYPGDWLRDAIWRNAVDDFGNLMVAYSGGWQTAVVAGTHSPTVLKTSGSVAAGDWARYQYVGYGFQLWGVCTPQSGIGAVTIDGNSIAFTADFYGNSPSQIVFSSPNLPLGTHVVQVAYTGTKNSASTGYGFAWDALKVMR